MTLLLLLPLASSVVCLSLDHLPVQDKDQEQEQDPAHLISIAEHLQKEHLGISNFNPSVRSIWIQMTLRNLYFIPGFTFSCSASFFFKNSAKACSAEAV